MKSKALAAIAMAIASAGMGAVPQNIPTNQISAGRSPKEYGQWLQYNRRQKWNKKGGRK